MRAIKFRVQNFRNVEDSGWVCLDKVTCFVGRNESGKTTLLKALHKFNPGSPEPYDPQREFPRDRYTRDYIAGGSKGDAWSVCSVEFDLTGEIGEEVAELFRPGESPPLSVTVTRHYDGHFNFAYQPPLPSRHLSKDGVGTR